MNRLTTIIWLSVVGLLAGEAVSTVRVRLLTLEEILTKMDQRGTTLRSMRADLVQRKWTNILEKFDPGESGFFSFLKEAGKVYLRKDIRKPQKSILVLSEGKAVFYQPKIKQAQRYNLGRNRGTAEFLLLGFGSDKQALRKTYTIVLLGMDSVGGRETYLLELRPKSEKILAYFSQIFLWVDSQLWVPIQQKLVEPTQDYLLFQFEDIELNPKLSKSLFSLNLPRDVKIVTH